MAENQKNSVKKSFWQRNLFLLIVLALILLGGGSYLYQNNILSLSFLPSNNENKLNDINIDKQEVVVLDKNNKELKEKVDKLESLILELAKNVQNIPETKIVNSNSEPNQVVLSNDEAYELILTINQIVSNIDQQQTRNKFIQKLQSQYLFFQESKFQELLTLPDYTFLLKELDESKKKFVQKEFMKKNNYQWIKKIIVNIFEINIAESSDTALSSYINALTNRHYDSAIIEYEKLNSNEKNYFQSTFNLAKQYNSNQVFLENMI
tara:strand:- start:1963 stop:2757 length:795 start_codon:yes stop_codon:yes gene_type:complete